MAKIVKGAKKSAVKSTKSAKPVETKIAASVGIAVMSSVGKKNDRAKAIQDAMQEAIVKAQAEGITDTPTLQERMQAARKAAVVEYDAKVAEQSSAVK